MMTVNAIADIFYRENLSRKVGVCVVRPFTDDAAILNAHFSLEHSADSFDLILDSWTGPRPDGSPPRNPDYNAALDLLLARLGQIEADLRLGVVDSREMQGKPLGDRRLDLPNRAYAIA